MPLPHGWQDRAACKDADAALFYGPSEDDPRETAKQKESRIERAKQICRGCPVQTPCLDFHLQASAAQYGVAGGLDEDERQSYRRRQQRETARERRTP